MRVMNKNKYYTEIDDILNKYRNYARYEDVLSIPTEYWNAFDELEKNHQTYYELFQNHYEDLKYYALMYRDVELTNHIFMHDMFFFTQKKNEILGFKKRILADNSLKAQIVRLFYDYEPMFVSFCCETLDMKPWRRRPGRCIYNYQHQYIRIKNGNLITRFSINKLTNEQCRKIIENRSEIINSDLSSFGLQIQTEKDKLTFKNYWFNDSDNCRAYFRCNGSYSGIFEVFSKLETSGSKYIDSDEYKNFCKKPFERTDVDLWIYSVKEYIKDLREKEIIERKRKAELERIEHEKRMEKYRFNKRNAHTLDKNIELRQSDHIYIVNGIALDSVTTFVNNAFPKFNAEFHAKRKAEQLGISPEEVLEMWEKNGKESRDLGTSMHSKIENYYLGYDSEETDAYKLFKIFASKIELKPYRTEWAVYDWEHKIAGTIDFVDYQNGEYILYDWKRSEKIIENGMPVKINKYGEKGNYPLEHLDNTPYYHYALQLSLYKYILEKNYGMKISDLRLGIFHPTYNKPYVLRMPYLEKEINDIFSLRSEVIF